MTGAQNAGTATGPDPENYSWNRVLRSRREAAGVTREGWAAALGYGRTTVQRWEMGETIPDAAAEQAIIALCRERGLFRILDRGPFVGLELTPEALSTLLVAARRRGRDGNSTARAPVAAVPASSNLPLPLTSFIGRERELAEVSHLFTRTRLLTLIGTGGVGKSRLALEAGRTLVSQFQDGVWLVELAPLTDPALLPQVLAAVLGVRDAAEQSVTAALADSLRPKHMLLILDNCEHLVAACAQVVERLLQTCPDVHILATSRELLSITGEAVIRVSSLAVPDLRSSLSLDRLAQFDAVRLFIERVRDRETSFALTDGTAPAVAQICRRLDGIPLALELAAARASLLSIDQMAARLDDRFRLLTSGSRTAPPRHRTLRTLLDWSYDLLDADQQRLFESLSVFSGSFELGAAEVICGEGTNVVDMLGQLVDKSLVSVEETRGEVRYRLLETIRQYAGDHLATRGQFEFLRRRHRDHYLALAEHAEPALRGPDQARWFDRLADDYDNLRAALRWCEQEPGDGEAGLRLARALYRFWDVRGLLSEGRSWLGQMLASGRDAPPIIRARALNAAGSLASNQGDYVAAVDLYEQSLAIARSAGDRVTVAIALANLGLAQANMGDVTAALPLLEEGLAIRRDLGDRWGVGNTLHNLASLVHRQGDLDRARTLYEESLAVKRELKDTRGIAATLHNVGDLALRRGEYQHARSLFEGSLCLQRELGEERGLVLTLASLGDTARHQGDLAAARSLFEESLTMAMQLGLQKSIAECSEALAAVVGTLGKSLEGARLLGASAALRDAINAPPSAAERANYDHIVESVRSGLDEPVFATAWAEGRAMAIGDAIAQALQASSVD